MAENNETLTRIGSIMESMGIDSVELAEKLKAHVMNCPGGRNCLHELLRKE